MFVLGFEFKFNESFKPMKERSLKVELLLVFRFQVIVQMAEEMFHFQSFFREMVKHSNEGPLPPPQLPRKND